MRKSMLLLLNIQAGRGKVKSKLADVIDMFTAGGYDVLTRTSQDQGDVGREIKQRGHEFDVIVVSGGDGTLHEAVNGLMRLTERPPLGYLPTGTVNDFANSLKISRDIIGAAETILQGHTFCCDVGDFNGAFFSYVAAFGAVTDVAYETPQVSKNILGRVAYFLEGVRRLPALENYHIEVEYDDGRVEGEFLLGMVTNASSVAGFKFRVDGDYKIALDDGLFEVILVPSAHNLIEGQQMLNAVLRQDFSDEALCCFKTSKLKIHCPQRAAWTLDGEYGGTPTDILIQNCPRAIRIFVDQEVIEEQEAKIETV